MSWCTLTYEEEKKSHYKSASNKTLTFFSWSSGLMASIRKSFLTERDVVGWVNICGLPSSHPTCVTSLWAGSRSPHRKTQKNCAWGSLRLSWRQDFADTESWGGSIVRDLLPSWMGFGIITSSLCWTGWCPQHFFPNTQNPFGVLSSSSLNRRNQCGVQEFIPILPLLRKFLLCAHKKGDFFF